LPPRARKQDVDARDTNAFARVFDALCAGMTTERLTDLSEIAVMSFAVAKGFIAK